MTPCPECRATLRQLLGEYRPVPARMEAVLGELRRHPECLRALIGELLAQQPPPKAQA